jgi:2-polyprenyl-3-methyl-5-hydroxy-6-metoxy-1,4-benzoquinol methylase
MAGKSDNIIKLSEFYMPVWQYIANVLNITPDDDPHPPLTGTLTNITHISHQPLIGTGNLSSDSIATSNAVTDCHDKSAKGLSSSTMTRDDVPVDDRGYQLTSSGPASYPSSGNILDNPDLLWTEDQWDADRYEEAKQRILEQGDPLTDHWKSNYIDKASKYWHLFYKRNQDHFYKDRHYLHVVFPELASSSDSPSHQPHLLEVGCGVGNAILPLLEIHPTIQITAIDFADSAVRILQEKIVSLACDRIHASRCDIVNDPIPAADQSLDYILCMFVLSAIDPMHHPLVLNKLFQKLKYGGKLFFRDYGR